MSKKRFFNSSLKFCMLGSGSWATALMKLLLNKQTGINWYVRSEQTLNELQKTGRNPRYLSGIKFDIAKLQLTNDANIAVKNANVIVLATPAAFLEETLSNIKETLTDKFIVSAVKGLIPSTNETITEFLNREYQIPYSQLGVISGPCHAEEVALERLSFLTFSCKRKNLAEFISGSFEAPFLKMIASTDVYGSEYAAVLKNIYAVAAGIYNALGYGDNFQSVLVSNAFEEMRRFLNDTNLSPRQTTRSAYLGDLLVTCYSQFSRNRTFGGMVGKGYDVEAIKIGMNMVAEGYYASKSMYQINKSHNVSMPIANAVYEILHNKAPVAKTMKKLTELMM